MDVEKQAVHQDERLVRDPALPAYLAGNRSGQDESAGSPVPRICLSESKLTLKLVYDTVDDQGTAGGSMGMFPLSRVFERSQSSFLEPSYEISLPSSPTPACSTRPRRALRNIFNVDPPSVVPDTGVRRPDPAWMLPQLKFDEALGMSSPPRKLAKA